MLLALRLLYESTIETVVKRPARKYSKKLPPRFTPLFQEDAEILLSGVRCKVGVGRLGIIASAVAFLRSGIVQCRAGIIGVSVSVEARLKGARVIVNNSHESRISSVTLGAKNVHYSDDDEVALLLST